MFQERKGDITGFAKMGKESMSNDPFSIPTTTITRAAANTASRASVSASGRMSENEQKVSGTISTQGSGDGNRNNGS